MQHKIWTIGHSTRTIEEFVSILNSFEINVLADIRRYPGSKKYPWFNKEALERSVHAAGISYVHFEELGGRRKPLPNSPNSTWKNEAFRGYADYMETKEFKHGVDRLISVAKAANTAYMCSEAVWWRCHRMLLSDYLKSLDWEVMHIMKAGSAKEHSYSAPFISKRLL